MSDGMKRREFLKVLGVSGAGVAAAGCGARQPDTLLPYTVPPEDVVPGMPTYYTSTCRECPAGCGIHVETHEARVTKVEGNPDHPINRGNTCARGQASVQGLYHPDRFRGPFQLEESVGGAPRNVTWTIAEQSLAEAIRQAPRGSVVLLTGVYGGTMDTLADEFAARAGARRVTYAPLEDTPRTLSFADADYLVSFGADILETYGSTVDYSFQFAQMRAYKPNGVRGKFVWVGPHRPLTGINADQWIRARPGTEALVAQALSGAVPVAQAAEQTGVPAATLEQLAREWGQARRKVALGPGYALRGTNTQALSAAVDALNGAGTTAAPADMRPVAQLVQEMAAGRVQVILIDASNPAFTLPGGLKFAEALRKVRTRVSFSSFPDETAAECNWILPQSHFLESWDDYVPRPGVFELVQPAMRPVFNTKQVGDVLLAVMNRLGGGSGAASTAAALPQQVGAQETAAPAGGAAPAAPATPAPAAVAAPSGTPETYYEYLVRAWAGRASGSAWRDALKRGGVFPTATPTIVAATPAGVAAATAAAAQATAQPAAPAAPAPAAAPAAGSAVLQFQGEGDYHLVVYPSYRFYDGRTANRPWLLELPDPVTKVPWDGWVEVHPAAARRLNIEQGDVLEVRSQFGAVELPAYVWPGVREDTVAIQMGLGHAEFGRWTKGRGANPMTLLGGQTDPATGAFVHYGLKVAVRPTGEGVGPRFQGLYENGVRLQYDRRVAQAIGLQQLAALDQAGPGHIPGAEATLWQLKGNGGFKPVETHTDPAASYPPAGTEYGEYFENDTRWGMVIDLQRCIGCGACSVACSAENNIPVVGPSEMKRGRELGWLRIERYFGTSRHEEEAVAEEATDDVRFLPMLCQHCGQAPCEPVCPVYAAYHTPDGLNGQVYNRCVGTRYCANNCPWKVRVFNWFTYEFAEPLNWQLNPDVTVREKGVMEKCTFCVQRIHEAERQAGTEMRAVRDGEVVPACVQACPTEVFTFGNFTDPNAAVTRAATTNRGYRVLGELNTQPAIVYLKKVTLHTPKNGGHDALPAAEGGGTEHMQQGEPKTVPAGGSH
jgi:anaerobic selenocysteine-containing dehydrogenase/Fe-S-cluster-containing dehydrogenase component